MSRSYKKHPAASTVGLRSSKRWANKKVRGLLKDPEVILNHCDFKKAFESCEIRDYREVAKSFEKFFNDEVSRYEIGRYIANHHYMNCPPNRKESWNTYQRWYVRK